MMRDAPRHQTSTLKMNHVTDPLETAASTASAQRHTTAQRDATYPDPDLGIAGGAVGALSNASDYPWSQHNLLNTQDIFHSIELDHDGREDLNHTRELAGTRKSRSRNWPARSANYPVIESSSVWFEEEGSKIKKIGQGMNAGQNLMAIFRDLDDKPRTKYLLEVERGRNVKHWPQYPRFNQPLRAGMSLEDICLECPGHAWGTGLRLFIAEGWTGERIYRQLPLDAANHGAATRKWNFLQQAMGREVDRMQEEDGQAKRVPQKRKRVATDGDDSLEETPDLSRDTGDTASDYPRTPEITTRPRKMARTRAVDTASSPASKSTKRNQSLSDMTGGEDIYRQQGLKYEFEL